MTNEFPVYVVDDDDAVRRSVGFMLKTSGYQVEAFVSGDALLKSLRNLDPGCIVLDVRMQGMDGFEVQQKLRERGADFPVVMMTGHGDVNMAVKAMKAGAVEFVEKPFEKAVMLDAVAEAMERLRDTGRRFHRQQEAQTRLNGLTTREREVMEGLMEGYPNKTIGYDLGISPRTVEIHRSTLMHKMEVTNLSDLLRIGFVAGLGSDDTEA